MFYAVNASNGFGIYDDYDRLMKNVQYMRNPIVTKFDDRLDATLCAVNTYNDYQKYYDDKFLEDEQTVKTNWFYFKSQISEKNLAEFEES